MSPEEFIKKIDEIEMMVSIIYDQVYERPDLNYLTPQEFQELYERNEEKLTYLEYKEDKSIDTYIKHLIPDDEDYEPLDMEYRECLLEERKETVAGDYKRMKDKYFLYLFSKYMRHTFAEGNCPLPIIN